MRPMTPRNQPDRIPQHEAGCYVSEKQDSVFFRFCEGRHWLKLQRCVLKIDPTARCFFVTSCKKTQNECHPAAVEKVAMFGNDTVRVVKKHHACCSIGFSVKRRKDIFCGVDAKHCPDLICCNSDVLHDEHKPVSSLLSSGRLLPRQSCSLYHCHLSKTMHHSLCKDRLHFSVGHLLPVLFCSKPGGWETGAGFYLQFFLCVRQQTSFEVDHLSIYILLFGFNL